jgi:AraC-like DNA-binding protein
VTSILERDVDRDMTFMRMELPEEVACKVQLVEQFALLINNAVVRLSGAKAHSREIWFLHAPAAPTVAYARKFRTPVKFHQGFHGLFFSDSDMRAPVVGRNEIVFLKERKNFAALYPMQQISIETRVRRAVERGFAEGSCTRERVAVLTELHERTLHRRLAAAGTSFQAIREQVRRKLALRYLAQPDLSLTVVTELLGYSEPAVLSRSCQRWFNAAPAELRRRLIRTGAEPASYRNS